MENTAAANSVGLISKFKRHYEMHTETQWRIKVQAHQKAAKNNAELNVLPNMT